MKRRKPVFTIWFTGVPASGKTTLAGLLCRSLRSRGRPADVIDGDKLRQGWCANLGFSKSAREKNIRRAASLARLLNDGGVIACVALVSPYRRSRDQARRRIGSFVEAHVDCPVSVCRARDPKGLYARAARGKLSNLTGVGAGYEPPLRPEVRLETSKMPPSTCLKKILSVLKRKKLV